MRVTQKEQRRQVVGRDLAGAAQDSDSVVVAAPEEKLLSNAAERDRVVRVVFAQYLKVQLDRARPLLSRPVTVRQGQQIGLGRVFRYGLEQRRVAAGERQPPLNFGVTGPTGGCQVAFPRFGGGGHVVVGVVDLAQKVEGLEVFGVGVPGQLQVA